ncbi:hypothetical protein CANTEDRAFT_105476 [Yamadazyma tenuis ATCC 10573]|uniref:Uncharacterized protein n=2 Tax=Candida tenuis TaxID=2315449 RepID=G3B3L0_CANTC|nr:uncharacterized protein CANTEDRAFT_105476 [Yamadazyma tenuis ATCC 10573]EGV64179.1 hypothetical protein CANTEDRAFT_105476 [Yamadazyma tenuis ATCC 10573]
MFSSPANDLSKYTTKPTTSANDLSKYTNKQLTAANKVTRSREELMSEMIVSLPQWLLNQATEDQFEGAQLRVHDLDSEVKWKRKVNTVYDKTRDIFIPCDAHEIEERFTLLYFEAEQFVKKLISQGFQDLPPQAIVMVEKYHQYLTKIDNLENRIYKNKVLGKENRSTEKVEITVKEIEAMANKLEYNKYINIFPVKSSQEALDWIVSFTYTISDARYNRLQRSAESNLIAGTAGHDYKSTYIETIRKFKLMPTMKCERLFVYYDNLYKIYQKFVMSNSLGNDDDDRRLVPETTEKGMRTLFTSDDPEQVIYDS